MGIGAGVPVLVLIILLPVLLCKKCRKSPSTDKKDQQKKPEDKSAKYKDNSLENPQAKTNSNVKIEKKEDNIVRDEQIKVEVG